MNDININYISEKDLVTVTKMNNATALIHLEKMNTKQRIQKINKNEYVDISTGEIKEFNLNDNRGQNLNSIGKTMNHLRALITHNFSGAGNELFATVTYKENQRDLEVVQADLKRLTDSIRYKYKELSKVEYITVLEPQERGAWHAHILFKFTELELIEDFSKSYLLDRWQKATRDNRISQVDVQRIEGVRNVSNYLITYLANIEYDPAYHEIDESRIVNKEVAGEDKKFIKGARLHLYPSGMRIYRSSGGISRPEKETMTFKESVKYTKKIGHTQMTFGKSYDVVIGDFTNSITRLEFSKQD